MASVPSVSYSITVRLEVPARPTAVSELTTAIEGAGGVVTALDVTASGADRVRVDVTCAARDSDHSVDLVEALRDLTHQRDDELQWERDHNQLHVAADSSVAAVRFRSSLKK